MLLFLHFSFLGTVHSFSTKEDDVWAFLHPFPPIHSCSLPTNTSLPPCSQHSYNFDKVHVQGLHYYHYENIYLPWSYIYIYSMVIYHSLYLLSLFSVKLACYILITSSSLNVVNLLSICLQYQNFVNFIFSLETSISQLSVLLVQPGLYVPSAIVQLLFRDQSYDYPNDFQLFSGIRFLVSGIQRLLSSFISSESSQ